MFFLYFLCIKLHKKIGITFTIWEQWKKEVTAAYLTKNRTALPRDIVLKFGGEECLKDVVVDSRTFWDSLNNLGDQMNANTSNLFSLQTEVAQIKNNIVRLQSFMNMQHEVLMNMDKKINVLVSNMQVSDLESNVSMPARKKMKLVRFFCTLTSLKFKYIMLLNALICLVLRLQLHTFSYCTSLIDHFKEQK